MIHRAPDHKRRSLTTLALRHILVCRLSIIFLAENYTQYHRLDVSRKDERCMYRMISYSTESLKTLSIETFIPAESYILINLSSKWAAFRYLCLTTCGSAECHIAAEDKIRTKISRQHTFRREQSSAHERRLWWFGCNQGTLRPGSNC